jgi:hypothetical protein
LAEHDDINTITATLIPEATRTASAPTETAEGHVHPVDARQEHQHEVVETTARTFMTSFNWLLTFDGWASRIPVRS